LLSEVVEIKENPNKKDPRINLNLLINTPGDSAEFKLTKCQFKGEVEPTWG